MLAPWQKIDALNTFVLTKLGFALRTTAVSKSSLNDLDRSVVAAVKKWTNLPKNASNEVLYIPYQKGGVSCFPLGHLHDICVITQAAKMLNSKDQLISGLARNIANSLAVRNVRDASQWRPDLVCQFLNGLYGPNVSFDGGNISSLWARARAATRKVSSHINVKWSVYNDEIKLVVNNNVIDSRIENALRSAFKAKFLQTLINKPDQGKVLEVSSKYTYSNFFYHKGGYIRFADWRFVTKARLNCVALNGNIRWRSDREKMCRVCGYNNETLPHVLNHCRTNFTQITARHNAIQDRLLRSIGPVANGIFINKSVPNSGLNVRPDIVIKDDVNKTVLIIDVTCPFENRINAFIEARAEKVRKYSPLAQFFSTQGYKCEIEALIVGSLGSWDPLNERLIRRLSVNRRFAKTMRHLMVADAIRYSRDIYVKHLSIRPVDPTT